MKKINWLQILATVSITTIITVFTGMLLFKWQQPKKQVIYKLNSSTKFNNEELNTQIHNLTVSNQGSVVAENLVLSLKLEESNSTIKDYKLSINDGIEYEEKYDTTNLNITLKNLNPKENLSISFLTEGKSKSISPNITVRANGINGIEKGIETENDNPDRFKFLSSLFLAAITLSTMILLLLRKGFSFFWDLKGDDSQNETLSYYCSIHNLEEEVERYLNSPKFNLIYYWTEADRLTMKAMNSNEEYCKKIISVLNNIFENRDSISKRSQGVLLFDIAKLYKNIGDDNKYQEFLNLAKSKTPKLVEKRMEIDPYFKENDGESSRRLSS